MSSVLGTEKKMYHDGGMHAADSVGLSITLPSGHVHLLEAESCESPCCWKLTLQDILVMAGRVFFSVFWRSGCPSC